MASAPAVPQLRLPGGQLTLPFRLVDDDITVQAAGPAGQQLALKFDTGANIGLLRRDTAGRLGLAPQGAQVVSGHGGSAELQVALVRGLRLGGVELPPYAAGIAAAPTGPAPGTPGYEYYQARLQGTHPPGLDDTLRKEGIDGLLGTVLLNCCVLRVDYRHQQLTLFDSATFEPQARLPAGTPALPLYRNSLPFTEVVVDGKLHGGAFFNTGTQPLFNLQAWALDREAMSYPVEGIATGMSIHGPQMFGIIRPAAVELGGLRLVQPATYLEMLGPGDAPDESLLASFGSAFFHDHVVTFDLARERVYIEADAKP
jgi:hypothetical protein